MTPIKNQGKRQICWVYAMLAAIETEHLRKGDSVNLSAAYIYSMMKHEPNVPDTRRGMGATLLTLSQKYGLYVSIVAYVGKARLMRWLSSA